MKFTFEKKRHDGPNAFDRNEGIPGALSEKQGRLERAASLFGLKVAKQYGVLSKILNCPVFLEVLICLKVAEQTGSS